MHESEIAALPTDKIQALDTDKIPIIGDLCLFITLPIFPRPLDP